MATLPWPARSRSMAAIPDEASARMSTTKTSGATPSAAAFDDADGNAAGAQQPRDLPFELFVVTDDRCCKLCHGSS